jgi:hypothetical protein
MDSARAIIKRKNASTEWASDVAGLLTGSGIKERAV